MTDHHAPAVLLELDPTTTHAPQPHSFNEASDLATARGAATTALDDISAEAEAIGVGFSRWIKPRVDAIRAALSAQAAQPIGYLDRFNVFYPERVAGLELRAIYDRPAAAQAAQPNPAANMAGFCEHCGYDHSVGPLCTKAAAQAAQPEQTARLMRHREGGIYEYIGTANGAGTHRGGPSLEFYRGEDGHLWYRTPANFIESFTPILDQVAGQPVRQPVMPLRTIDDYEGVLRKYRHLVRELDVLLNGEEGAAPAASLADIISQVKREEIRSPQHPASQAAQLSPISPATVKHEVRQMLYQGYSIGVNHFGDPLLLKDGYTVAIIKEALQGLNSCLSAPSDAVAASCRAGGQLAQPCADTAYTDFLERMHKVPGVQCSALGYAIVSPSRNGWKLDDRFGGTEHKTLRAAIDAAIAAQPTKQTGEKA